MSKIEKLMNAYMRQMEGTEAYRKVALRLDKKTERVFNAFLKNAFISGYLENKYQEN